MDPRVSLPPRARRLCATGALHALAVWLVLGHSYVAFLQFHEYSLTRPEVLIGLAFLTAVLHGEWLSTSDVLTPAVFDDRYSLLLAVKIPGVKATYDSRGAPLPCILEAAATSGFRTIGDFGPCAGAPHRRRS